MIAWVKDQKDIDYVIVYHFNRVFRDAVDAGMVKPTTATFLGSVACLLGTVSAARTERASLRTVGLTSNRPLLALSSNNRPFSIVTPAGADSATTTSWSSSIVTCQLGTVFAARIEGAFCARWA